MADNDAVTSCAIDIIGTQLDAMREEAKRRVARLLGASEEDLYAELAAPLVAVKHQQWVKHLGQPSVPLRWRGTFLVQVDAELATDREQTPESAVPDNVTSFRRGPLDRS